LKNSEGNSKRRAKKVNLIQTKVNILAVVLTQGVIPPDPKKIKSVKNFKPLQTI